MGSKSNTADFKDKILREFSKEFPRERAVTRAVISSGDVASQQRSEMGQETLDNLKASMIPCSCMSC